MSSLTIGIDSGLARTVAFTTRLRQRPTRFGLLTRTLAGIDWAARATFHVWRNRRYLTFIKLANMALVNVQFKLKNERVLGRPYKMKIESTNICNTKCQLCPTGVGLQGRPKGKMSIEQFRGLIDQVRWHLVALDLSMWGDPLIVPEIYDMVSYAHRRGVWTYLSSNLHAFKIDKDHAERLVDSELDLLTCSLHGASQATYEQYQPGKRFDDAVAKVRHIIETRNRMGRRTPQVQLNFVVTRFNEHERPRFERLAAELGGKAVFSWAAMNVRFLNQDQKLHSLNLSPELLKQKTREHLQKWLPEEKKFVLKPYRMLLEGDYDPTQFNGKKMYDCSWPWRESVINWDGAVSTCCGSFDPGDDMGNVLEHPFGKVWNSPKYRLARRSFKKRLTDEQAQDNPCASCPGFML